MTEFRTQHKENGKDVRPLVSLVMNFTKPTPDKPSLLTFDEVTTFLHEFGHALHGMLSQNTYQSTAGTNVYRDFVELPSQLMENWAIEKPGWTNGPYIMKQEKRYPNNTSTNSGKPPISKAVTNATAS